jgi:hypothetical protein
MDNNLEYRFIRDDTDLPITVVVGTSAWREIGIMKCKNWQ